MLEQQLASSQEALRRLRAAGGAAAGLSLQPSALFAAAAPSPPAVSGARVVRRQLDGSEVLAGAASGALDEGGSADNESSGDLEGGQSEGCMAPTPLAATPSGTSALGGGGSSASLGPGGAGGAASAAVAAAAQLPVLEADLSSALARAQRAEAAVRSAESALAPLRRQVAQLEHGVKAAELEAEALRWVQGGGVGGARWGAHEQELASKSTGVIGAAACMRARPSCCLEQRRNPQAVLPSGR